MAKKPLPTPKFLRQLLDYDPATGILTWRERPVEMFKAGFMPARHYADVWNNRFAKKPAGTVKDGYTVVVVQYRILRAHRVIWAMVHGEWPDDEIDHINHNRADNRIANLRIVTRRQNQLNHPLHSNNTSGCTGVRWDKRTKSWRAEIGSGKTYEFLGRHKKLEDAVAARSEAEQRWGAHANHGT